MVGCKLESCAAVTYVARSDDYPVSQQVLQLVLQTLSHEETLGVMKSGANRLAKQTQSSCGSVKFTL